MLTIDREEKRNALNALVRRELLDALDRIARDDSARAVILTGTGDKAFAAGADVAELAELAERTVVEQREAMESTPLFDTVAGYPKPTIAMINGVAAGGGCELALACDLRVAAASARLGQPEVNLGLMPGGGGTQRLTRLVGRGTAMRLVLTGELVTADEALRVGLVDLVVSSAELADTVQRIALSIAAKPPVAVRLARKAIRAAEEMPLSAGLTLERDLFLNAFATADAKEGIEAFIQKRAPRSTGR